MSSITHPYEDIEFPAVSFKPDDDQVSDFIEGLLESVRHVEIERDGEKKYAAVLELLDDGGGQFKGHPPRMGGVERPQQAADYGGEANAQLGDRVRVTFEGRDKGAKNPTFAAKWFKVEVV